MRLDGWLVRVCVCDGVSDLEQNCESEEKKHWIEYNNVRIILFLGHFANVNKLKGVCSSNSAEIVYNICLY